MAFRRLSALLAVILTGLAAVPAYSQTIVINEFMASNSETISDEDGDYPDWIELYNPGVTTVNLEGWGLTDDLERPFRWVFPDVVIQPGKYLLVWASGKDRRPSMGEWSNGILREVYTEISGSSVSDLTSHPNYPDNPTSVNLVTEFFEAPINYAYNYGQRMHGLLEAPQTGYYTFWISSDDSSHLYLSSDENPDNMVRIARVNGWTNPRQWDKFPADQESAPVFLEEGQYYYICALMKQGGGGDNLAVRWQLPDETMEEPIPASQIFVNTHELHTNFAIAAAGEPLQLTMPGGTVADMVEPVVLLEDISYGRATDGGSEWLFFKDATPKASNNLSTGYTDLLLPPVFSQAEGFSVDPFYLELDANDPNAMIYYTLDGSEPDEQSLVYTGPILIANRDHEQNAIADIETTPEFNPAQVDTDYVAVQFMEAIMWMPPPGPVKKATAVRAKAIKAGAIPSSSTTQTYWVDPAIATRFTLPVVSLNTHADNLFDPDFGIYVRGSTYHNSSPTRPWHSSPANYRNRGDAWERPAHIAFYGPDGAFWLDQNVGIRIHGGATRAAAQKTLRLYARSDYGEGRFRHPFFEERPHANFNRLVLRNSGNDWNMTLLRDAMAQRVVRHMNVSTQAYQPMAAYINGEYWGIHNMRERYDKHYLARMYGVDADNLDHNHNGTTEEGSSTHYNALANYISANTMTQPAHLAYVETQMDIDNYIDYFITQIFTRNSDWGTNHNTARWRLRTSYDPDAPYGHDGRWRWLPFDLDFGYGYAGGANDYTTNMFSTARNHSFFDKLLNNAQFRQRFVNRFADQLNTAFLPNRILGVIDQMQAVIAPEMPHHIERWQRPASMQQWQERVDMMRTFATHRANAVRGHIRSQFNLGVDRQLAVNVSNASHGHVRVNTIDIAPDTPGVDAAALYPWIGLYYQGVPITVTAVAEPGYVFSHWSGPAGIDPAAETLTLSLTSNVFLMANFEPLTLLHYWHFNGLTGDTVASVAADQTILGTALITYPGEGDGYMDSTDGSDLNARLEQTAGQCLRVRNPSDTRELLLTLPTTGFETIRLSYAAMRTANGAQTQTVEYRTSAAGDWQSVDTVAVPDDYALFTFDFSDVPGVSDNPEFAVRLLFGGDNASGVSGNNRFDNITLEGLPMEGTNLPPEVVEPVPFTEGIEHRPIQIDLSAYFSDPDDDALTFTAQADKPFVVDPSISGSILTLTPLYRGDAVITLTADDGYNLPVETGFRILVYPAAHTLRLETFGFDYWSSLHPEHTFPANMLFLQSDVSDPKLEQALEYPYFIPHDDYHADDQDKIGYPYMTTGRTRLNGLFDEGIAFINTGRGRDLGGVLMAIDTTGLEGVRVSWLGGTILENFRRYAIRLQYRVGIDGPFMDVLVKDVLDNDEPVEYVVATNGHTQDFDRIALPAEAVDQPYVQLLWRYYHIDITSGARAQLRLDDIVISGVLDIFENLNLFAQWWLVTDCELYNHCGGSDLTRDGTVNLEDFAVIASQWVEGN